MASPTQPQVSDFPDLHPVIHLPPNSHLSNVILFFPGLGDTSLNFASFAKALNLPDALTITLQPPYPLPFPVGPGWHWSDDLQIDAVTGAIDENSPVTKASNLVAEIVCEVLISKHKFAPNQVHFFGWGQGGSLALTTSLHESIRSLGPLGSVVTIGVVLPLSADHSVSSKSRTPLLLVGGAKGALSDDGAVKRTKSMFDSVEVHKWKKMDDSMPKNREEILPIMQFWGRVLKSRRGVPPDAVQVN